MRRRLCALMMILALPLAACGGERQDEAEKLLQKIRGQYLQMEACEGHGELTADYGRRVYSFGIDFTWKKSGETHLVLTSPDNVAGAAAHIADGETALEYDGVMLETGPLDPEGLSPLDALPALLTCCREGYLAECVLEAGEEGQLLHVVSRDPEKDPGVGREVELWFAPDTGALVRGEISSDGVTVIQCRLTRSILTGPESG